MRSSVAGLPTPHPLGTLLPAFMQEDSFTVRLTEGLDAVLAPVMSVLDCLDAYVDPLLAPEDFLVWLADWVGAALDEHSGDGERRRNVLSAAEMHRSRGTVAGLRAHLELATGGDVEVIEAVGSRSPSARRTPTLPRATACSSDWPSTTPPRFGRARSRSWSTPSSPPIYRT